jgi:RNA polymerase sigma-70 factor (ECF subfamily)
MVEQMADGYPLDRARSDAVTLSADAEIVESRAQSRARYASPEALFVAQNDSLVRALTFSCGDPALAEDSVQEAFARLLVHWERIYKYDDPATWVRRVALNLTYDHRRSVLRRTRLLNLLSRRPGGITYSVEGNPQLYRAVRELPDRQRTALSLYYLGDLKVAEVATAMGISPGTVKGYLDRARETLREKLETSHDL